LGDVAKLTAQETFARILRRRDDNIRALQEECLVQFEELVILRDAVKDHQAVVDIYQAKIARLETTIERMKRAKS